jgi:hypothetical protein
VYHQIQQVVNQQHFKSKIYPVTVPYFRECRSTSYFQPSGNMPLSARQFNATRGASWCQYGQLRSSRRAIISRVHYRSSSPPCGRVELITVSHGDNIPGNRLPLRAITMPGNRGVSESTVEYMHNSLNGEETKKKIRPRRRIGRRSAMVVKARVGESAPHLWSLSSCRERSSVSVSVAHPFLGLPPLILRNGAA